VLPKRAELPEPVLDVSVSRKIASSSTSDWCATSLIEIAFSRICEVRRSDNSSNDRDGRSRRRPRTSVCRPPLPSPCHRRAKLCQPVRRYITENDLSFFKAHMEQNVPVEGATNWEPMMNRDFGSFTYTAWRRILPVSLTYLT